MNFAKHKCFVLKSCMHKNYLSDEEFFQIYTRVPRLNVDLVIKSDDGILFALRNEEPCLNEWNLIGGTVYKEELISDAVVRVAKAEAGLDVKFEKCLGYMEFPHEARNAKKDPSIRGEVHTISIVLETSILGGELRKDENARDLRFFKEIPENTVKEHRIFLEKIL